MKKFLVLFATIILLSSLILVGCSSTPSPTQTPSQSSPPASAKAPAPPAPSTTQASASKTVEFSTYPVGTNGYNVTSGFAKIVGSHSAIKVNVRPMSGATEQLPMVNRGEINIGLCVFPDLDRAAKGIGEFTTKLSNLRQVAQVFTTTPANLIVRKDSQFKKISDLKGKRITSGFGSTVNCQLQVEVTLASAGMTWKDVVEVPVPDMPSSLNALREGRVDAAFGLAPTVPATMELNTAIGVRMLPIESGPAFEKALAEKLPGCKPVTVKAGTGIATEDVLSHDMPFVYYSSVADNEDTIYQVLKALWDNSAEIQNFDVTVKNFSPQVLYERMPVAPYHSGVIKLLKEKGVWTKEMEDANTRLLGK